MSRLFGREALDPRTRFPHLTSIFDAVEGFALPVAQGLIDPDWVENLLLNCRPFLNQSPDICHGVRNATRPGHFEICWALRDAVRSFEGKRSVAKQAMRRELAPLLDQRADTEALRTAARAADPECVLLSQEHRALIAREQAWWVRLHVALGGEDDLAA